MVGSERRALAALRGEFREFAAGSEQRVYRVGRVVYKVEIDRSGANRQDWKMYQDLARGPIPVGIAVPAMSSYEFGDESVIASTYIEGDLVRACPVDLARLEGRGTTASSEDGPVECPQDGACIATELAATLFDDLHVTDIGHDNLIRSRDGTVWIIDLY